MFNIKTLIPLNDDPPNTKKWLNKFVEALIHVGWKHRTPSAGEYKSCKKDKLIIATVYSAIKLSNLIKIYTWDGHIYKDVCRIRFVDIRDDNTVIEIDDSNMRMYIHQKKDMKGLYRSDHKVIIDL